MISVAVAIFFCVDKIGPIKSSFLCCSDCDTSFRSGRLFETGGSSATEICMAQFLAILDT